MEKPSLVPIGFSMDFGLDHLVRHINGFGKGPMHFFGFWGTLMLIMGFGFTLYLEGIDKLYLNMQSRLITQRPEFYIALTTMILGLNFLSLDFWEKS